jgi:general secretion pathway protein I
MTRFKHSGGFTLVEVMVALAVVAVALPALLFTLDQQIDGTAYLRERSQAQWVAANRLAEIRLLSARPGSLRSGRANGELEMAGQTWFWRSLTEETQIPGFYRVDVNVAAEPGDAAPALASVSGFLAPEQPLVAGQ